VWQAEMLIGKDSSMSKGTKRTTPTRDFAEFRVSFDKFIPMSNVCVNDF